jgi:hypothetical protein
VRRFMLLGCALASALVLCSSAYAAFPYKPALPPGPNQGPNDLPGGKLEWMYAATPEAANLEVNLNPQELGGVRGAHLVDNADVDQAWRTTTGRPDVAIAVLDSGIKWNDARAMFDLRRKVRLNVGELPAPAHDRASSLEPGQDCATYRAQDDANGDGVVNLIDWSCDARVQIDPAARGGRGVGPADVLDPQDVLIAFSDGRDGDGNGFVDDIAGWDFLDDDNDPFDDVQYGHGTGEALDSSAEADNRDGDNGRDLGTCPNCVFVPLRVGDSFIADVNDFAQAVIYATDNGVLVVQEALGTLNHTTLGREAVQYAYDHGVTIIASAADEAAQHHNWPSSYPHVIVVNSVTKYDEEFTPAPRSYLQFTGCTNFSSKIAVAIPSVSCSSDATGRGSGMAGLIYSAALDARRDGRIADHPTCRRTDGSACVITPNEVRQLMASGQVDGRQLADDVNFAFQPEPSCTPLATPACTDPYLGAPGNHAVVSPVATTRRYPARKGHDQFYGWGRANLNNSVDAISAGRIPPEVEIASPDWYAQIDPGQAAFDVRGTVDARGGEFSCRVYVAPGSYPNNAATTDLPAGDFKPVSSGPCDGSARSGRVDGTLASVDVADLKRRFPPQAGDFTGAEPGADVQRYNGRPNIDTYGFTIKVVATARRGSIDLTGEDRRNAYVHRDRDLLPGFPKQLGADGAASPLLVDLDGDGRNELVVATGDGIVHAFKPNGREARGWPVRGDRLPLHTGGRAFTSGAVRAASGAFLASVAAADVDRDGSPEVVAADFEGHVYAWSARGRRLWTATTNVAWSGKPLAPFADVRRGKRNRTQRGFIGSPVLADVDRNDGGRLEVVAAAMDRHLYAWNHDGRRVRGFPVTVVDPKKVASIDPATHRVTFNDQAGRELNQGAIVATPAVGDITGDGRPEILVGTNEEYAADAPGEGGINASPVNTASVAALEQTGVLSYGNSRLYALRGDGSTSGDPILPGWPFKVGKIFTELLPVVGEGVTGSPVIGPVDCPSGGKGPKVGVMPDAGVSYVLNPDGTSCYGRDGGKDRGLQTDVTLGGRKQDSFAYSAVGQPAFGRFAGGVSYMAPATGIVRALDLAVNEYQGGQDYVGAWDASTGQFRPGFPAVVNDLQFLTGPSVADVDGVPGEELLAGTASLDVHAFGASGADAAGWPKLTSDWMVTNPAIGTFGQRDDDPAARKVVAAATRSGSLFVYRSGAGGCAGASWPRFHHDNANSGDYRRDAVAPGKPGAVRLSRRTLKFTAPGDDGLCGRAARYQVVESDRTVTGRSFGDARAASVRPAAAGAAQSIELTGRRRASVGIRAVDEQGNAGPVVTIGTARRGGRRR